MYLSRGIYTFPRAFQASSELIIAIYRRRRSIALRVYHRPIIIRAEDLAKVIENGTRILNTFFLHSILFLSLSLAESTSDFELRK